MGEDKVPESIEIEKKLLSAMMLKEGEIIPQVIGILKSVDFYREEHRKIYRAMCKIYNRKEPPDVLLIEEELRKSGELAGVRLEYLYSLIDMEWTTSRAEGYARVIKEKSVLRQLIEYGEILIEEAQGGKRLAEELLENASAKILSMTLKNRQVGFEGMNIIMPQALEEILNRASHPGNITGVRTKIIGLDRILNGFQKSDLILLAARPSMGKTALALNIALNAAECGSMVAIISLEMSKQQLAERLLSTESGIDSFKIKTGNLTNTEMREIMNSLDRLTNKKISIDDTVGMTLLEIRSKLRKLKHEQGLDLIVIDYLQLMTGIKAENRQQEISEISRNLKGLARELEVPLLALSQLSRSVEMRADKKPQLSDLRESGSLEQDADIVMFLYRDEYYNREDNNTQNTAELIIAKNRNGPTTTIGLQFKKETMRFGDLTRAGA